MPQEWKHSRKIFDCLRGYLFTFSRWFQVILFPVRWITSYNPIYNTAHTLHFILYTHSLLQATGISTSVVNWRWKFTLWLRTYWENVVWSFVEYFLAVLKLLLTKRCAIFGSLVTAYLYAPTNANDILIQPFQYCLQSST